jgi:hypothetical protein
VSGRTVREEPAGLAGPVAIAAGLALLGLAPLLRGGDYFIALLPLEIVSLALMAALVGRAVNPSITVGVHAPIHPLAWVLVSSPAVIAAVQLALVPVAFWEQLPGHAQYAEALRAIRAPDVGWRPVSISPDATRASLLAGIPPVAAFLLGQLATHRQLRLLLRGVVAVAFFEVLLGLLQLSGGEHSPLYFGMMTYGSPIGSLGTRNEYANFLAMALAAYVWLAYDSIRYKMRLQVGSPLTSGRFDDRHALAAWVGGGLVLVVGILISHSRAGAVFGLGAALFTLGAASLRVFGWSRGWRFTVPIAILLLAGAVVMVGLDAVVARVSGEQLRNSAGYRGDLVRASWGAAWTFFPLGSGWGTFDIAFRPFQPRAIVGYPNHAHMDYVEMFVEGGALFLVFFACAAWLVVQRTALLLRHVWRERTLDRESMMAALCGIGLFGFLLHAAVDFPMRVPANAILAALLAGVFLRPLVPGRSRRSRQEPN